MKKIFLILCFIFFITNLYSQIGINKVEIELYDAKTGKYLRDHENITYHIRLQYANYKYKGKSGFFGSEIWYAFVKTDWDIKSGIFKPDEYTKTFRTKSINSSHRSMIITYELEINSPDYETVERNEYIKYWSEYSFEGSFADQLIAEPVKVFLVEKNQVISGELDVNINNSNDDLDVLSAKEVANSLGVTENDIIKLIQSGKLKGKKIGEKYFVTKEELKTYISN